MTANPPAQPRPPPHNPPPANPFRVPSRQNSTVKLEQAQRQGLGHAIPRTVALAGDEARPVKKRKVESPTPVGQPPAVAEPQAESTTRQEVVPTPPWKLSRGLWDIDDGDILGREVLQDLPDSQLPSAPSRPWKNAIVVKTTFESSKCGDRVRETVPVANTPDDLVSPDEIPKIGKCALAGFFPWIGKHPEDRMTENNIKHGYFDRPPNPPEKELNTSKGPVQHVLKQKLGLDTLSTFFSLVLDGKCRHGNLSTASTFKPPPRVTLTEAKRKSWLADLADAEIPLRRLTRSIPQGIRGQSLLDQCLVNTVPISRAVWFAKCVGANEIRSLKRKGTTGLLATGNEGKWLKEWTLSVEQFIETLLRQNGQSNWRSNIQYVVRLCTRLYLDNLLDRDHYLDWVVRSFAAAGVDRTPFWLMIVHVYYRDLTRFRRRGKGLAEALLEKIEQCETLSHTVVRPLMEKLKSTVHDFVRARPACFFIPERWPQFQNIIQGCLDKTEQSQADLFRRLQAANGRLLGHNRMRHSTVASSKEKLLKVLDSTKTSPAVPAIAEGCKRACDNDHDIIMTILAWSTTRYTHSSARLYLAVRLLRHWQKTGSDIETSLLSFVAYGSQSSSIDPDKVHHLFAELSRSKTFSISRYIQWLTVHGGLRRDCFDSPSLEKTPGDVVGAVAYQQRCRDPSQLLTELSLDHLDEHVRNLRDTTLRRAGFDADLENEVIERHKGFLTTSLPSIVPDSLESRLSQNSAPNLNSLSWSIKSRIALWLRSHVLAYSAKWQPRSSQHFFSTNQSLDIQEFCVIRNVLEQMGDISILADVLGAFLASYQEDLLAAVADTVNRLSGTLGAIGAFDILHQKLCSAYVTLRPVRHSLPLLATSLVDLCRRHPSDVVSVKMLLLDLVRGDRGRAVAACSPFSDGVAESLQHAGPTFIEDFEAILQSEPSMNEETLSQLFGVLAERIAKEHGTDPDWMEYPLCQLLARLRLYRPSQCDQLIDAWLVRLFARNRQNMLVLVLRLISTGCLSYEKMLQLVERLLINNAHSSTSLELVAAIMFDFRSPDVSEDSVHYRFQISRDLYLEQHPVEFLKTAALAKASNGLDVNVSNIVPGLLTNIVAMQDSTTVADRALPRKLVSEGLDSLLGLPNGTLYTCQDIRSVIELADELATPFCRLRLKLSTDDGSDQAAEKLEEMAEVIFDLAQNKDTSATNSSFLNWPSLLEEPGSELAALVRRRAEEAFFAAMPSPLQPRSKEAAALSIDNGTAVAQMFLDIAFQASSRTSDATSSKVTTQLIEKFSLFLKCLGNPTTPPTSASHTSLSTPGTTSAPSPATASIAPTYPSPALTVTGSRSALLTYLPLLLQMTCLNRPAFSPATTVAANAAAATVPSNKQAQQDQIKILVLLVTIALHPTLTTAATDTSATTTTTNSHEVESPPGDLVSYTLDVAATLVDDLSDEARSLCARFLKDKMRDERIQWLFGSVGGMGSVLSQDVGSGLVVVRKEKDAESGTERKRVLGEWKVRQWEVLEAGSGGGAAAGINGGGDGWVGLGVFEGRRV